MGENSTEAGDLHGALGSLAERLTEISEGLAEDRKERDGGVSILRLQVPFVLWFGFLAALVTIGTPTALFVHDVKTHLAASSARESDAKIRGGIAYNDSIDSLKLRLNDQAAQGEALNLSIGTVMTTIKSPAVCRPVRGSPQGTVACRFPELALLPRLRL
jgi:hypothetical protein